MKRLLFFCILIAISQQLFAQIDSSKLFEKSKGKWSLQIPTYYKIYDNENLKRFSSNQFDSTLRIITDYSHQVKAVYDGKIISIIKEDDKKYSILTKFGSYFICYSNVSKPEFKEGEFVKAGQILGHLEKDYTEEYYTLEIMLSNGENQHSAEKWINW